MNDTTPVGHARNFTVTCNGRTVSVNFDLDPSYSTNQEMLKTLDSQAINEPEVVQFIMRTIWPGDIVIDAGANIGYFTCMLSKLVGVNGKVIAIEPGSNNLPWLKRNLMLNACANIDLVEKALWSEVTTLTLYEADNGGTNSLADLGATKKTYTVPTVTLAGSRAKLIKLDIEGAECHALCKMGNPDDCPYIIAELNEPAMRKFNHGQHLIRNMMKDRGYSTFLMTLDGAMPVLIPPNTNIVYTRVNGCVLFSTPEHVGRVWSLIAI